MCGGSVRVSDRSLGDLKDGRSGRVRLGASMAFEQKQFLNDVIAPFCRKHGGTTLSLRFGHSRRQRLLERAADEVEIVIPAHFAGAGAAEVRREGSRFAIERWAGAD
jgi:DNA-binding transcriptional LysR family regulator